MSDRAKIDFSAALDNLGGFEAQPTPKVPQRSSAAKVNKAVAESAGFRRREPEPVTPARKQRRHRTGRTHQINVKVRPEYAERLYHVVDTNGLTVGETFERAIELLEKAYDIS